MGKLSRLLFLTCLIMAPRMASGSEPVFNIEALASPLLNWPQPPAKASKIIVLAMTMDVFKSADPRMDSFRNLLLQYRAFARTLMISRKRGSTALAVLRQMEEIVRDAVPELEWTPFFKKFFEELKVIIESGRILPAEFQDARALGQHLAKIMETSRNNSAEEFALAHSPVFMRFRWVTLKKKIQLAQSILFGKYGEWIDQALMDFAVAWMNPPEDVDPLENALMVFRRTILRLHGEYNAEALYLNDPLAMAPSLGRAFPRMAS